MKMPFRPLPLAIALALAAPLPAAANGLLFFVKGQVSIVGADGKSRPAKRGDQVLPRERLVTGPDAMVQLRLEDGSFIGIRPDSDLRIQDDRTTGPDAGAVLTLNKGTVRVLNLEGDSKAGDSKARPLPVQLQSADGARVMLRAGDAESGAASGGAFVTRLNAGTATAFTTQGAAPLAVNSVSTIASAGISPAAITALPPISFSSAGPATAPLAGTVAQPAATANLTAANPALLGAAAGGSPAQKTLAYSIPGSTIGSSPTFSSANSGVTAVGTSSSRPPLTAGTYVSTVLDQTVKGSGNSTLTGAVAASQTQTLATQTQATATGSSALLNITSSNTALKPLPVTTIGTKVFSPVFR